jgi:hypothetical protein
LALLSAQGSPQGGRDGIRLLSGGLGHLKKGTTETG